MTRRLGVLIAGLGGAVGSTVAAGVALFQRGIAEPTGLLTEGEGMPVDGVLGAGDQLLRDGLDLARLDDIAVGGWDIASSELDDILEAHHVVPPPYRAALRGEAFVTRYPGYVADGGIVDRRGPAGSEALFTWRHAADAMREDIRDFRRRHELDDVVVVCLLPTRKQVAPEPEHTDIDGFEALLDGWPGHLAGDMVYLYAAIQEGCGWVNFTPNVSEVPALIELAEQLGTTLAGRDGKTGQTFLKTVLAPALRARQLRVRGWFSTNILGNRDGVALRDPEALRNKLATKTSVLEQILGYDVGGEDPAHIVTIHYYAPRGDAKEAWDNIDLEGFLGAHMSLKVDFLCKDSILAAPLVIDLARLSHWAGRNGERGFLGWLAPFFKFPLVGDGPVVHDYFQQMRTLAHHLEAGAGRAGA